MVDSCLFICTLEYQQHHNFLGLWFSGYCLAIDSGGAGSNPNSMNVVYKFSTPEILQRPARAPARAQPPRHNLCAGGANRGPRESPSRAGTRPSGHERHRPHGSSRAVAAAARQRTASPFVPPVRLFHKSSPHRLGLVGLRNRRIERDAAVDLRLPAAHHRDPKNKSRAGPYAPKGRVAGPAPSAGGPGSLLTTITGPCPLTSAGATDAVGMSAPQRFSSSPCSSAAQFSAASHGIATTLQRTSRAARRDYR